MLASGVPNEAISGPDSTTIDLFFQDRVPSRPSQRVILGLSPGSNTLRVSISCSYDRTAPHARPAFWQPHLFTRQPVMQLQPGPSPSLSRLALYSSSKAVNSSNSAPVPHGQ